MKNVIRFTLRRIGNVVEKIGYILVGKSVFSVGVASIYYNAGKILIDAVIEKHDYISVVYCSVAVYIAGSIGRNNKAVIRYKILILIKVASAY